VDETYSFLSLADRVAVITGAGGALGQASALQLGLAGARLVLAGRKAEALRVTGDILRGRGIESHEIVTDVRDDHSISALVEETMNRLGRIDIVVNNAGGGYLFPLENTPVDRWDNLVSLNLRGPYLLTQEAGRHMIAAGGGVFVNISSMAGVEGVRGGAAYSASKSGLQMFTRVVAAEWGRHGIRANCIAPGFMVSEASVRSITRAGGDLDAMAARVPLRRLGNSEDIARAVLFLASDASSYISGETLAVNGGPTMGGPESIG
jgi:citronellol/citronellal dehydrogenase